MALSIATCPGCGHVRRVLTGHVWAVRSGPASCSNGGPRVKPARLRPASLALGYFRTGDDLAGVSGAGKASFGRSAGNAGLACGAGRRRRVSVRLSAASSSSGDQSAETTTARSREWPLPRTSQESVDQAIGACKAAIADGLTRLQIEVLLPLIGATDLDDWPGGIQQQFRAAEPIVEYLLQGLAGGGAGKLQEGGGGGGGGYGLSMLDEGDAVGLWEREAVAAVVFPTADTLAQVEQVAIKGGASRPLLLINAQWQGGQVVSDFGFGAKRRTAEAFVGSFTPTYFLKQMRILGEEVRILRRYPDGWQVFVVTERGEVDCVAVLSGRPEYRKVEEILKGRKGSKAGQGWFDRLMGELKFNQDSLKK